KASSFYIRRAAVRPGGRCRRHRCSAAKPSNEAPTRVSVGGSGTKLSEKKNGSIEKETGAPVRFAGGSRQIDQHTPGCSVPANMDAALIVLTSLDIRAPRPRQASRRRRETTLHIRPRRCCALFPILRRIQERDRRATS